MQYKLPKHLWLVWASIEPSVERELQFIYEMHWQCALRKSGSLTSVTGDGVISIQQYSFSAAMVRNNRSHFKTNCLINSILPELFQVNITCDGRKIELCTDLFAPSGARKFWGFEEILARSSHQSEIPVPRGRGGGGVYPQILCWLTKSQVFLCLVVLWCYWCFSMCH